MVSNESVLMRIRKKAELTKESWLIFKSLSLASAAWQFMAPACIAKTVSVLHSVPQVFLPVVKSTSHSTHQACSELTFLLSNSFSSQVLVAPRVGRLGHPWERGREGAAPGTRVGPRLGIQQDGQRCMQHSCILQGPAW